MGFFKVAAILFGLLYVIGLGLEGVAMFNLFGSDVEGGDVLLNPLGYPWTEWFPENTSMGGAPAITLVILIFMAYLGSRNR
ncbi:hypothetical protein [Sphingomicrobium nitratireducens]|uniref:hypothetical protein n=1 Tax=Sphingomicrobium nitratireducens TaxID=2964666 RepID=UPI00223EE02F|nr:hypothetical protein [Sphingomicrobium nitratireducens]